MTPLPKPNPWPPTGPDDNAYQVLILDFLERCRELGRYVRIKDMEQVMARLGLTINSQEHFLLLMADWESGCESGFFRSETDLMEEYPAWKDEIRLHIRILDLIDRYSSKNDYRGFHDCRRHFRSRF